MKLQYLQHIYSVVYFIL